MKLSEILKQSEKPELYEKGTAVMWTDPYISKQLLDVHLDPNVDLASRKAETISSTVEWILSHTDKEKLNILDLGCGPGLYAEYFAQKGHAVTAVDFSENSISYARKEAIRKQLDINYIHESYLELDLKENQFDLVILIFADFGPLLPREREQLLEIIRKVTKPAGIFIFDVLNDTDIRGKISPRNWDVTEKGFWKDRPYLALSESFLYEEEKVILYQHFVMDELDNIETYRFWNHFFSMADLTKILHKHGFDDINFFNDVLPSGDGYRSTDLTFCKSFNMK